MTSASTITPLPKKQIFVLLAVRFAEPVSFTFLFPFLYFMVRDFKITDNPNEIGYYVGLIASSFAIAQFCTSVFWGFMSDRFGRRPIIMFGLFGVALSLIMFGMSTNLTTAIISRVICGAVNGNVGVMKSMMAEITDETNRAKGFSYLPMVFVLGTVLGPALGGFLSNPADKYSFLDISLFRNYPYLLPCAMCSLLCICGAFLAYFMLKETHNYKTIRLSETQSLESTLEANNLSLNTEEACETSSLIKTKANSKVFLGIKKDTWLAVFGACGLSFQGTLHDELLPLWAATAIYNGGLSFDSSNIGTVMSVTGLFSFVLQFFLNAPLQMKLGGLRIYRWVCYFSILLFMGYPLINLLASNNFANLVWIFLCFFSVLRATSNIFALTSVNLIMADTSDPSKLGLVNGIDQTCRSLSRAFAPLICGSLWSWSLSNNLGFPFNYCFCWFFLSFVSVLNSILARFTKKSSNT